MSYVFQNLSLWRVRKTAQQPPVKTLCPWEHLRQKWPVFTTVKIPTSEGKFSRRQTIYAEKAHTGSTADCLNFPSGFLLGVASLWLGTGDVYYLQLPERRDWTERNASVMWLCRHIHASLYWLPDILCSPRSLHTRPFTDRSLDHTQHTADRAVKRWLLCPMYTLNFLLSLVVRACY